MRTLIIGVLSAVLGPCVLPPDDNGGSGGYEGLATRQVLWVSDQVSVDTLIEEVRMCGGVLRQRVDDLGLIAAVVTNDCVDDLMLREVIQFAELDAQVIVMSGTIGSSGVQAALPEMVPFGAFRMGIDNVWDDGYFGLGARVAIVDTGIDCEDSAFAQRILYGIDVLGTNAWCRDQNGHGTMMAGIIADPHDGVGTMGEAPNVTLYDVKVLEADGVGFGSDVAAGVVWAAEHNVDVILLGFGGFSESRAMENAIDFAIMRRVSVVIAAGNVGDGDETTDEVLSPATHNVSGVIVVGATDEMDFVLDMSSSGPEVDVFAPASFEYTSVLGGGYAFGIGTSFAAARVAGAVALLRSQFPLLDAEVTEEIVIGNVSNAIPFVPAMLIEAYIGWEM